jgi:hypothetical protein
VTDLRISTSHLSTFHRGRGDVSLQVHNLYDVSVLSEELV